jgi:hypothetical protein
MFGTNKTKQTKQCQQLRLKIGDLATKRLQIYLEQQNPNSCCSKTDLDKIDANLKIQYDQLNEELEQALSSNKK